MKLNEPYLLFTRDHDEAEARRRYRQRMGKDAKYCKVEGKYLVLGDEKDD